MVDVVLRDVTLRDGLQDEEPVSTDAKLAIVEALVAAGVRELELTSFVRPDRVPAMAGLGVANALAAIDVGIRRLDGSVGALGGCPFAPGASGNLALEDLAHALEADGVATGLDVDGLIEAASIACATVGRDVGSHVGIAGPRFAPRRGA